MKKYIITFTIFFFVMIFIYDTYRSNFLTPSYRINKEYTKIKLIKKTESNPATVIYMKDEPETFLIPEKLKIEIDKERFLKSGKVLKDLYLYYNRLGDEFIKIDI